MPSRPGATVSRLAGMLVVTVVAIAALFALRAWNDSADDGAASSGASAASPPAVPPGATATPTEPGTPSSSDRPDLSRGLADPAAWHPVDAAPGYADELALLATIEQRPRGGHDGYHREEFGERWADVDGNGCDTRNDVLARDLRGVELRRDGCLVQRGTLDDPFTGTVIAFERGPVSSEAVQIDHVVALYDAWRTGARDWDLALRTQLANDPANLLAVDGPANQAKGHADAATWLPPNEGFRCEYVGAQVRIKAAYGLWMTAAEHEASSRVLSSCD